MIRMLPLSFACCLLLASAASAQDSLFKTMWPLGKSKQAATPTFDNINPFVAPKKSPKEDKLFNLPSPSKFMDKAGETTETMFTKTREGWQRLNPFAPKSKTKSRSKSHKKTRLAFLDRILPKKKNPTGPSTVGEFISMKRP